MYKKIMVPLDGSELAECVLDHVEIFIKECKVDKVVFIRMVEPFTFPFAASEPSPVLKEIEKMNKMDEMRRSKAEEYLKQVADRFKNENTQIHTKAMIGSVPEGLIEYMGESRIDLVIMATHGRSGVSRWVRGSVADRVLRASFVPVLLVRAPGTTGAI